jgi:hypothetical protein
MIIITGNDDDGDDTLWFEHLVMQAIKKLALWSWLIV